MTGPDYLRCDACQKPVAEVRGTTLRILVRHNSHWHLTVLTLDDLDAIVRRMRETTTTATTTEYCLDR